MTKKALLLAAAVLASPVAASAQPLRPDQAAFRAMYKELVETNTSLSSGSCTLAAERMAAHLKAAGFKESEITLFADPASPKEGGMVAVLPGSDPKAKPILLLAHIDVVEAKREDWTRDPFAFIEENGFFYGRGVADDKAQAAIWTDTLVRYRSAGKVPKRTLKLALTCGEETTYAFNGADWLAKNRPELIAADYALNEGGGGRLDANGKPIAMAVQVGEKTVQNYQIEATNPGGHSSVPRRDNAATDLAAAIININTYDFPAQLNPTTTSFFTAMSSVAPAPMGPALKAIVANPADPAANAIANKDPMYHSMLRTTCVVTQISAGHANNALAQRATANVNCRLFPGSDPESVRAELAKVIGNPAVKVTLTPPVRPIAKAPPMNPAIIGPMKALGEKYFPGVPMLATMSTGATDGIFLSPIGIPTYGVPGIFGDADGNGAHGLNERLRVKSVYEGRDYLYELVGILAD